MEKRFVVQKGKKRSTVNVRLAVHLETDGQQQSRGSQTMSDRSEISENSEKEKREESKTAGGARNTPRFRRMSIEPAPEPKAPVETQPVEQQPYLESPDCTPTYTFGEHQIPSEHVFLRTFLSYAFVNIKPILPGHVLVAPMRSLPKVKMLAEVEATDLFKAVRMVNKMMEDYYGVSSSTLTIQDGPAAGQSVQHVHVHVLPRTKGDMNTRELYARLAEDGGAQRSSDEMANEAAMYRRWFYQEGVPVAECRVRWQDLQPTNESAREEVVSPVLRLGSRPSSAPTALAKSPAPFDDGVSQRCNCVRCHRIQCPDCTELQAGSPESGMRSRRQGAAWTPGAGSERTDDRKKAKDEEDLAWSQQLERVVAEWRGCPVPKTEPREKSSWPRKAFAGVFVSGMAVGVLSTVKRLG